MTLKEYMMRNHPNYIDGYGCVTCCPKDYSFLQGHFSEENCGKSCLGCWNQPYIETTDPTDLPEEGEPRMSVLEAIETINDICLKMSYEYEVATSVRQKALNQMYSAAILAKEALEKQIPRKATSSTDKLFVGISSCCPNCENIGIASPWTRKYYFKYCPECGQALDWREENDT